MQAHWPIVDMRQIQGIPDNANAAEEYQAMLKKQKELDAAAARVPWEEETSEWLLVCKRPRDHEGT